MTYFTIGQVKRANRRAGYHFFDGGTMRFFDSRVRGRVYGGRYFITSEQFHGSNGYVAGRKWTVRQADEDGKVDSASEFQAFDSWQAAVADAKRLARA